MKKHVLSVLVENNSGVLSRIAGLFTRRGYNIDSLSVGTTENPKLSRMTITVLEDDSTLEQIRKQLNKLVPVIKVVRLENDRAIYRELVMIKVSAGIDDRSSIIDIASIFRGNIVDVSSDSVVIEMTGDSNKISGLLEMVKPFGIIEIVRTGLTGMQRGIDSIG